MDPDDGAEMPIGVKQKRPNCTQKIKGQKTVQEAMVKCALNGLLRGDRPCKESMRRAVQNQVMIYSKRLHLACVSLKLLLRETFRNMDASELGNVYVPHLFDQTFLRHLMLVVNETHKLFAEMVAFRNRHPNMCAMLDACERYMGDSKLYSFGAIKYPPNLKNHYMTGLTCWIKRWVYSSTVKYAVFVNRLLETHSEGRMFELAPLCQVRNRLVTFDTTVLYGVFPELGWLNADHPSFVEMSNAHCSSVLDADKVRGRDVKFTHTIDADDTSVCVHFKRPKKTRAKPVGTSSLVRLGPNDVGVQVVPVGSNILYCVWHDGCDHRSMVLKRRGYCVESGNDRANRKVVAWQSQEDVKTALQTQSQTSSKGVDLVTFLRYMQTIR